MIMEILASIILAFALLQLMVALVNFIFAETMKTPFQQYDELVSILVPARNEANNIEYLIRSVLHQGYPHFELIVCDDQSEDQTAAIVAQYAQHDQRIQLIQTKALPEGWLGKNHACHTLSQHAKGDYLLFLDADVMITGNLVHRAIGHMKKHQLALLSIFPRQIMKSAGEFKTVPVMNFILLTLLPLILVRKSMFDSLAAANGQFMFFDAETYHKNQPHALLRGNKVEDIAIARLLKKRQYRIACQATEHQVSCRMYRNYKEAVRGFSRNIAAYFGNSKVMAFMFWLLTTLSLVPFLYSSSWKFMVACLITIIATRILVIVTSKQPLFNTLKYLPQQQWAMGQFILESIRHQYKKQEIWKGRNISSSR